MADKIAEFLLNLTHSNWLSILLISAFPLIELKGAIPIGAKLGVSLWQTAGLAYFGSTLVCIPVFFLLIPIFNLLKKIPFIKRFIEKVESVLYGKAKKIALKAKGVDDERYARSLMVRALLIFVAVPLPVTGVWTGTAIAVFLGFKFKEAVFSLAVGNLIAGAIIALLTYFFKDYVDYIILGLAVLAVVMLVFFIVKVIISKPENNDDYKKNDEK